LLLQAEPLVVVTIGIQQALVVEQVVIAHQLVVAHYYVLLELAIQ
jgi:hypothetical protein